MRGQGHQQGIAVACPEWRGLKVGICISLLRDSYIAVACPEWRGLKGGLYAHTHIGTEIAVACPEWRGLKVAWRGKVARALMHCSGLPRMEGTESPIR